MCFFPPRYKTVRVRPSSIPSPNRRRRDKDKDLPLPLVSPFCGFRALAAIFREKKKKQQKRFFPSLSILMCVRSARVLIRHPCPPPSLLPQHVFLHIKTPFPLFLFLYIVSFYLFWCSCPTCPLVQGVITQRPLSLRSPANKSKAHRCDYPYPLFPFPPPSIQRPSPACSHSFMLPYAREHMGIP